LQYFLENLSVKFYDLFIYAENDLNQLLENLLLFSIM